MVVYVQHEDGVESSRGRQASGQLNSVKMKRACLGCTQGLAQVTEDRAHSRTMEGEAHRDLGVALGWHTLEPRVSH